MKLEDVNTWEDYKLYTKEHHPEAYEGMKKIDRLVEMTNLVVDGYREIEMEVAIYNQGEVPEEPEVEIDYEDDEEELTEEIPEEDKVLATV